MYGELIGLQVPTMVTSTGQKMTESMDMIVWLYARHPELLPPQYHDKIKQLLDDFYSFPVRALTAATDDTKDEFPNKAAEVLERVELNDDHRRRLEIKSVQ